MGPKCRSNPVRNPVRTPRSSRFFVPKWPGGLEAWGQARKSAPGSAKMPHMKAKSDPNMGPQRASVGPWAPRQILDRFWGPFGSLFWPPKSSKIVLIFELNSSTAVARHVCPSGGRRRSFWASIWAPSWTIWGSILGSRARAAIFVKSSTAPRREHDFHGAGGSKTKPK